MRAREEGWPEQTREREQGERQLLLGARQKQTVDYRVAAGRTNAPKEKGKGQHIKPRQ